MRELDLRHQMYPHHRVFPKVCCSLVQSCKFLAFSKATARPKTLETSGSYLLKG